MNLRLCDICFRRLELLHTKEFAENYECARRCSSSLSGWAALSSPRGSASEQKFIGMTADDVSLDALLAARKQLISEIRSRLDERFMRFLLSFHELKPDWELLGLPDVANLPAIRWKLMNLALLQAKQPEKYRALIHDLDAMLRGAPRSSM